MPRKTIKRSDLVLIEPPPSATLIIGRKFGRLTVEGFAGAKKRRQRGWASYMDCKCDCGNATLTMLSHIIYGRSISCGCFRSDVTTERLMKHGCAPLKSKQHKVYRTWKKMRERCTNLNLRSYKDYGGRGISVCERWSDFRNFHTDMGDPPNDGMSIERVNNDGNYCPENCIWIPRRLESVNRRHNWKVLLDGKIITAREADRRTGRKRGRTNSLMKKLGLDKTKVYEFSKLIPAI